MRENLEKWGRGSSGGEVSIELNQAKALTPECNQCQPNDVKSMTVKRVDEAIYPIYSIVRERNLCLMGLSHISGYSQAR